MSGEGESTCSAFDGHTSESYSKQSHEGLLLKYNDDPLIIMFLDSDMACGPRRTSMELIKMFSVYLPGSFSRHSIIADRFSFKADSRGGIFANYPSYFLTIPKGAIKEGESIDIQTGYITCVGNDRFEFPDKFRVVSDVVWFCADEQVNFQESLIVKLQHCAKNSGSITILKAKCSEFSNVFRFEPLGKGSPQGANYVTFETKHFCLYCAGVYGDDFQPRICVVPIEKPYFEGKKEVIFCMCYEWDTCIKVSLLCGV